MIKHIPFLLSLMMFQIGLSQNQFNTSNIPDSLRAGGIDAVVRLATDEFIVNNKNSITNKVHYAITVLNGRASYFSDIYVGYEGKPGIIKTLKAHIYDANGKLVKSLKKSDISDVSMNDQFYSDNRANQATLKYDVYPYTIEVAYELNDEGSIFYPTWNPARRTNVSVQNSKLIISTPSELEFRFKEFNLSDKRTLEELEGRKVFTWEISNYLPEKNEPFAPYWNNKNPYLITSPNEFVFGGYEGDASTWESIGKWQLSLNDGLDIISDELSNEIQRITADKSNEVDKIKAVYEYVQENTRYVSIQLGIGGWQPFSASYVESNGYGDCKALSNFTYSLLKSIGIKSYYTLIRAGENAIPLVADFPSRQFNHVILAVPQEADTIWLECTNQTNPFGYLGSFTGDRHALMVTENGGVLVKTPSLSSKENAQIRSATIDINIANEARCTINTLYKGVQYENGGLSFYLNRGRKDVENWIYKNTDIPSYDLLNFDYGFEKNRIPYAKVSLDLNIKNLASKTGDRFFISPNLMNRFTYLPPRANKRELPIDHKSSFYDVDSIIYNIPSDWYLESPFDRILIESEFGEYESEIIAEEGRVTYIRKLIMFKGSYPPESYKTLRDFYKSIVRSDKKRIVFLSKT
ncbi:MAG: DUF3857 and transglutaminase domain-containing protein [Bacteroidota bacterium]